MKKVFLLDYWQLSSLLIWLRRIATNKSRAMFLFAFPPNEYTFRVLDSRLDSFLLSILVLIKNALIKSNFLKLCFRCCLVPWHNPFGGFRRPNLFFASPKFVFVFRLWSETERRRGVLLLGSQSDWWKMDAFQSNC